MKPIVVRVVAYTACSGTAVTSWLLGVPAFAAIGAGTAVGMFVLWAGGVWS